MNFYLIEINANQVFYPDAIHNTVVNDPSIDAWWNHLPNTFIIRTSQTAQYHSNRIIATYPALLFFITKVDLDEYNGYMPQMAWDWIRAHKKAAVTYKKPEPSTNANASLPALRSLLSGYRPYPAKPTPTPNVGAVRRAIDTLLLPKIRK